MYLTISGRKKRKKERKKKEINRVPLSNVESGKKTLIDLFNPQLVSLSARFIHSAFVQRKTKKKTEKEKQHLFSHSFHAFRVTLPCSHRKTLIKHLAFFYTSYDDNFIFDFRSIRHKFASIYQYASLHKSRTQTYYL